MLGSLPGVFLGFQNQSVQFDQLPAGWWCRPGRIHRENPRRNLSRGQTRHTPSEMQTCQGQWDLWMEGPCHWKIKIQRFMETLLKLRGYPLGSGFCASVLHQLLFLRLFCSSTSTQGLLYNPCLKKLSIQTLSGRVTKRPQPVIRCPHFRTQALKASQPSTLYHYFKQHLKEAAKALSILSRIEPLVHRYQVSRMGVFRPGTPPRTKTSGSTTFGFKSASI